MIQLQMFVYSLLNTEVEALLLAASKAGVEVVRTEDSATASVWLNEHKCDGVVIDSALPGAERVLKAAKESKCNSKVATLSMISAADEAHTRISTSTTYVLWKGSPAGAVLKTFRLLYASIVAERQRYFRCPVGFLVHFRREDWGGGTNNAQALNLSRAGMAMKANGLKEGDLLALDFALPKGGSDIRVTAKVVRCTNSCVGVSFVSISENMRQQLYQWLSDQCVVALGECTAKTAKYVDGLDGGMQLPTEGRELALGTRRQSDDHWPATGR
jgi:hypothetical protein